jgi:hypothetical protein
MTTENKDRPGMEVPTGHMDEPTTNENRAAGANGQDIPPPDAPRKLSKYARFAASEETVAAQQGEVHACMLGSPPKNSFVRVPPDRNLCMDLHVLVHEVGSKRKTYLIDPALLSDPDLEGLVRIQKVVPYITHHTPPKLGLWPISVEQEGNTWIRSALHIVEVLRKEWKKVIPSRSVASTSPDPRQFFSTSRRGLPCPWTLMVGWTWLSRKPIGSPRTIGKSTQFARSCAKGTTADVGQAAVRGRVGRGLRVPPARRRPA